MRVFAIAGACGELCERSRHVAKCLQPTGPDAQGRGMRAILTSSEFSEHDAILEQLSALSTRVSRGRWDISP